MRAVGLFMLVAFFATLAFAAVFGTVRGIVRDPQHRPIPGANVVLKPTGSDYTRTTTTDGEGQFILDAVPLGTYSVTATSPGFAQAQQTFTLLSGTSPVLNFDLQLASANEAITVVADPLRRNR
jgi:hypothetical protein